MVVSVDGPAARPVPAGTVGAARGRTRRRDALRGLLGAAAALALAPLVAASRPARRRDGPREAAFDEIYLGRRLLGRLVPSAGAAGAGRWEITVDGRPLHLMRRADGTWLSMVDHYRSYADPLDAVRAAVDELGPGQMLRAAATGRHTHLGGHHGLHP
ncbi:tyrosinase family oxidase copper chaperone [Streptomyces sp. NPDC006259]|uniref:tyrosinase family oxidase copper chaperone n=1 Tax=Streptomyces sp. NPDC006259 TaxID=3364740 RepID=UPI0036B95147